jgi:hypothetical protein
MLPEYDLASMPGRVRGKYYDGARRSIRVVRLASDLETAYPDEAAITEALREHLRLHPELSMRQRG